MLFSFHLMGKEGVEIWTAGKVNLPDFWNCSARFSQAELVTECVALS